MVTGHRISSVNDISKEIDAAEASYNRGDFRAARKICKRIIAKDDLDSDIFRRAQRILAATGIDPVAKIVFAVTFFLLLFLTYKYIIH